MRLSEQALQANRIQLKDQNHFYIQRVKRQPSKLRIYQGKGLQVQLQSVKTTK